MDRTYFPVNTTGGKGRTGTVVAAVLLALNRAESLGDAVNQMQSARPGMLRNPLQQMYVWHLGISGALAWHT